MVTTGSRVILREKRLGDAFNDYSWQSDDELAALDAVSLFPLSYMEYLAGYVRELLSPQKDRRLFAIETTDGRHIGNCVYYNIDDVRSDAEIGIMIGDRKFWGKSYGAAAVLELIRHIFSNTRLKRIYLKTLVTNTRAQKCFKKCGFTPYQRYIKNGYDFIYMELFRRQWEAACNNSFTLIEPDSSQANS